jgi:hypothetical protein
MATTYSIQKTKWSETLPTTRINPTEMAGRVRIAYAKYEAAAVAVGTIEMFNLPNGARILSGEVVHDALGGSTTVSVGHAGYNSADGTAVALDVDEFKAAASSTSIATVGIAATSALGRNSVVDADSAGLPVTVVTAGAAATGTIELTMMYVVD